MLRVLSVASLITMRVSVSASACVCLRVTGQHFNPWFSGDATFMSWQLVHGRAFVVARSDWEYFFNTFAFGYALGYHFIETEAGSCNGNFLGIGADMCVNASVQVDSCDAWGLLITNGEFTSFLDPHFGNLSSGVESSQIVVTASNTGAVRVVNSAFWGQPTQHSHLRPLHPFMHRWMADGVVVRVFDVCVG